MKKLPFISPVVLLIVLTLPCSGCVPAKNCTFIPQSTSASLAIPNGFGVNIDFTDPRPGEIKMLSEAGFRWVRMDLVWEATEKEPGRYDFSAYDRLMTALEPFGIHALFILDYANHLYDKGALKLRGRRLRAGQWRQENISPGAARSGKFTMNRINSGFGDHNQTRRSMLPWHLQLDVRFMKRCLMRS